MQRNLSDNDWQCQDCDYKSPNKALMRNHIESKHMDSCVKCEICGYVTKTRKSLNMHKYRHHKEFWDHLIMSFNKSTINILMILVIFFPRDILQIWILWSTVWWAETLWPTVGRVVNVIIRVQSGETWKTILKPSILWTPVSVVIFVDIWLKQEKLWKCTNIVNTRNYLSNVLFYWNKNLNYNCRYLVRVWVDSAATRDEVRQWGVAVRPLLSVLH